MIVYLLFQHDPNQPDVLPWVIQAVDEYTIDELGGKYPEDYEEKRKQHHTKEAMIMVNDNQVNSIFAVPVLTAGQLKESE